MKPPGWWIDEFGKEPYTILDCIEGMNRLPKDSIDTIITDPPYGLEFMGKDWDAPWQQHHGAGFTQPGIGERRTDWPSFSADTKSATNPTCENCGGRARGAKKCHCEEPDWKPMGKRRKPENEGLPGDALSTRIRQMEKFQEWNKVWAVEALRVAKPGAFMLVFGGTRTWHRLACAIEDARWELRDTIMWVYGSGFPKNYDISKGIDKQEGHHRSDSGVGKRDTQNTLEGGILGNRCPKCGLPKFSGNPCQCPKSEPVTDEAKLWDGYGTALKPSYEPILVAMKPVDRGFAHNALKHGVSGLNIDGARIEHVTVDGGSLATNPQLRDHIKGGCGGRVIAHEEDRRIVKTNLKGRYPTNLILDEESGAMLDGQTTGDRPGGADTGPSRFYYCAKASRSERGEYNIHPTVKPLALMEYLVRLTSTPTGGVVLDPFLGSGTTLLACRSTGRAGVGFEMNREYESIIRQRLYGDVPDDVIVEDVGALDFF